MKHCMDLIRVLVVFICGVTTLRGTTRLHTKRTDLDPVTAPVTLSLPSLATVAEPATCHYLTDHIICYENASLYMTHSTGQGQEIKICFTAFSRRFDLILQRIEPTTVLSSHKLNITIIGLHTQNRQTVDVRQYYTGHLLGEPSRFYGHFQNGVLYGEIYTATETYFVEPFERYFRSDEANQLKVVVYRERDIMQLTHSFSTHKSIAFDHQHANLSIFYHNEETVYFQRHRQKRRPTKTGHKACGLKIIVDYNFYKYYCDGSVMKTVDEIVYAVTTANTIFRTMDFDSDGKPDITGFTIHEIVLHESNSSKYYLSESKNPLSVLNTFTKYDLSGYCLGVLFTYHELKDGVLGLAWRASSSLHGRPGGICSPRIHSLRSATSLNSLIVTADCYGAPLPRWLLALALTHELGHSFGSHHDNSSDTECFPAGYSGNYIMNEHITYKLKPNNKKFSKCSLLQMSPVVFFKSHCFETSSVASLCGNYILDPGEGCDCGPLPDQCHFVDPCCVPPTMGQLGCRVATELGKNCSSRVSACCSQDCRVETRSTLCRNATECTEAAFCNGIDFDCPDIVPRPDGTLCMGGMRLCVRGNCILSRCQRYDLEDCHCLEKTSEFCQLCCRNDSAQQSVCVPAYTISHTEDLLQPVYKPFGDMCGDGGGYCNNEHVCVTGYTRACVEIMEHIFNYTNNEVFVNWLLNQWFLVLAAVSFAVLCFALIHMYTSSVNTFRLSPYMAGKEIALKENIRSEHVSLADQLLDLESSYQWKLTNLTKGSTITMVVGVTRLYYLFPTVPNAVLTEVIKSSSCEELAVRWLLLKGYPMKKPPPLLHKC